jgi:hypothetical protein
MGESQTPDFCSPGAERMEIYWLQNGRNAGPILRVEIQISWINPVISDQLCKLLKRLQYLMYAFSAISTASWLRWRTRTCHLQRNISLCREIPTSFGCLMQNSKFISKNCCSGLCAYLTLASVQLMNAPDVAATQLLFLPDGANHHIWIFRSQRNRNTVLKCV